MTATRRDFAVVIGINNYCPENGIKPLGTAVNDAKAIAALLRDEYKYSQIWELFDEQATYENILTLLAETLPQQVGKGDHVLFYFAGHGITRKGKDGSPAGYLIPQDAKINLQNAEQDQSENFLPMQDLYDAFKAIDCHHLLVILDCCYAGMFRWATRKLIPIPERIHREHYDRFIRFPAWQVLASAAHDQEALDLVTDQRGVVPGKSHSPFAMALLQGLGHTDGKLNADFTNDGVITTPELYLYVDQFVNEDTRERQTPGFWSLRSEFDRGEFIFTKPGFDPKKSLTPAPPLDVSNNPYRGLESFEERHARFFFGRKALIEDLYKRLSQPKRSLTIVLGASGSGKSSLVKAGLIPYLREQQKKDEQSQQWQILDPMRPGDSPFTALARILLPIAQPNLIQQLEQLQGLDAIFQPEEEPRTKGDRPQQNQPTSAGTEPNNTFTQLSTAWSNATPGAKLLLVVDYFEELQKHYSAEALTELEVSIQRALKQIAGDLQSDRHYLSQVIATWSQTPPNTKLLLVIDQFEELITMTQEHQSNPQTDKKWQSFLTMLRVALASHRHRLHIVLTLRSDFEPRFLDSPLKAHWRRGRFPVRAMTSDELRQAIEGPALKQALYFEPPDLVGRLIDEVGQMPGALPLLSFTLSELYINLTQRWRGPNSTERALKLEDYTKLGGVAGSLTRRATEEYEQIGKDKTLGEAGQRTMQRVMLRMVTIEGGGVARRRVLDAELVYADLEENKRVTQVIDRLVKARLLVKGQETGESYVEPAHDFLVRGWDNLQKWIKQEQANLSLQRELTPTANKWKKWEKTDQKRGSLGLLWDDDPRLSSAVALMWKSSYKDSWLNFFKWLFIRNYYRFQNNSCWLNSVESEFIQRSLNQKFKALGILIGTTGVVFALLSGLTITAFIQAQEAIAGRSSTQQELESVRALRQFEVDQNIAPLVSTIRTAWDLDQWRRANHNPSLQNYRTVTPIFALQSILDNIHEKNEIFAAKDDAIWQIFGEQTYSQERILSEVFAENADSSILAVRQNSEVVFKDTSNTEIGRFSPTDQLYYVDAIAFSSDSQFIAVLQRLDGGEGTEILSLLKLNRDYYGRGRSLLLLGNITGPRSLGKIAFTNDNQYLVTGELPEVDAGLVRFWSLQPRLLVKIDDQQAFLQEEQYLHTEVIDNKIKVLNESGQQIAEYNGEANWFQQVFLNQRNEQIISLGEDGKIRLWSTSGNFLRNIEGHQNQVEKIVLSLDGNYLATLGDTGVIITSIESGERVGAIAGSQNQFYSISFSPDGQRIATLGLERTARIWDLRGRQLAELSLTNPQIAQIIGRDLDMGDGFIPSVKFTSDGEYLAIFSSGRNTANPPLFWKIENLDDLLKRGCQWLSDYFKNSSVNESDKQLCLSILNNP